MIYSYTQFISIAVYNTNVTCLVVLLDVGQNVARFVP